MFLINLIFNTLINILVLLYLSNLIRTKKNYSVRVCFEYFKVVNKMYIKDYRLLNINL